MVLGGMTQTCASEKLGVNIRTIRRWLSRYQNEGSLENMHGRGRKSKLTKVVKIVIAKSISKRHQSTRKLAAPAHTAKRAQEWCNTNLVEFWHKSQWPGNSPDLNPIENLWSVVKQEIELMDTPTNISMLEKYIKQARSQISPETLENLVSGMPKRMKLCIKQKGGYIGK
ncbi:Transposase [Oopsacas minuta]|uniref:Transposase n=1 Tax=Oopsacas minuta TaxID=111878 RepID=A0AAV7JI02_9METZ|nr:Transposase [Oopsacas minuta]